MSVVAEFEKIVAELKAEGHHIAERLAAAVKALHGDAGVLVAEVHADAMQVAQDAGPVVAEVEADAVRVAGEAVADVQAAAAPDAPAV